MVSDRPAVDVCIKGNICDSTAGMAADIIKDSAPVFVVQQRFDPAKDQRDAFEDRKKSEYSPVMQLTWIQSGSWKKDIFASAPAAS